MSGIFWLMRLADICAILPMTALIASRAFDPSIPRDRDGSYVVSDVEMDLADLDYKKDNICSVDPGRIEHKHMLAEL